MKEIIVEVPFLPAAGMALFPFILVKATRLKKDEVLINHERIHISQQRELLIIPFYLLYCLHYGCNLIRYRNHHKAYMGVVFEREAYAMERQTDYLKRRKLFSWVQFF